MAGALLVLLAVGCSQPAEPRSPAAPSAPPPTDTDRNHACDSPDDPFTAPRAEFCDPVLHDALRIGRIVLRRTPRRIHLSARIPIRNISTRTVHIAAQVEFRDHTGAFYGDRTPRRVLTLAPGQTRWLRAVSARACAEDLTVRLAAVTPRSR